MPPRSPPRSSLADADRGAARREPKAQSPKPKAQSPARRHGGAPTRRADHNASHPLVQKRSPHRGQHRVRRRLPPGRCAGARVRDGRHPAPGASRGPSTPAVPVRVPRRPRRCARSRGVQAHRGARRPASVPAGPRTRVQGIAGDLEPRLRPVCEAPGPDGSRCAGARRSSGAYLQGSCHLRRRRAPHRPGRNLHRPYALSARVVAAVSSGSAPHRPGSCASGVHRRGSGRCAPEAARARRPGRYDRHPARRRGAGSGAAGRVPRWSGASLSRRPGLPRRRGHLQALAVSALRRDLGTRVRARRARAGRGRSGSGGGGQNVDRRAGVGGSSTTPSSMRIPGCSTVRSARHTTCSNGTTTRTACRHGRPE